MDLVNLLHDTVESVDSLDEGLREEDPLVTHHIVCPKEKLQGAENYVNWIQVIETSIKDTDLDFLFNKPKEDLGDMFLSYEIVNLHAAARAYITRNISADLHEALQQSGWTEKVAGPATLAIIKAIVMPRSTYLALLQQFMRIKREDFDSLREFLNKLRWFWDLIQYQEPGTPESLFVAAALNGIQSSNPNWHSHLTLKLEQEESLSKEKVCGFLGVKAWKEKGIR